MANPAIAARNTLILLAKEGHEVAPVRDEEGIGPEHAVWLLTEVVEKQVEGEKAHRWLSYAHGVLVERQMLTLQACKFAVALS